MNTLTAPAATSSEVTGHFDYILDDRAYGWAFAPAHPQKRLTIEILSDGEVIAQGPAQEFRQDLQTAGMGDGCYLFGLKLSHELFDGNVHSLAARVAETGVLLPGGPHEFGPELRQCAYPQIPRALGLDLLRDMLTQANYSRYAANSQNFAHAYRLASRLQETGEYTEAREAWTTINRALGENPLGYCKLGECLMLLGLPEEALEAFRIAASRDLRLHWAHLGVANSHFSLGEFELAEEAMQVAIALKPEDSALANRLKFMQDNALPQRVGKLMDEHKREAAVALLKAFLLKRPDSNQACTLLGDLLCEPANTTLPGMTQLHELRKAQSILDALLDDVEARLDEANE
ncbi:tetratricopeptide repeat protein [Pseudomonas fulva]|uniref:tetratricopeptide repeat protein n=1 Tax=Pseudomonas fulva TaxID=47880 RepID=UPI002480FD17|nr:tetratricopeptide repeat protein [Pseudomonas fulva]